MLKTVFVLHSGLVAAFDYEGNEITAAQGDIVDFYYQFMREKGLASESTEFNYRDDEGLQQKTGAQFDAIWRRPEEPCTD